MAPALTVRYAPSVPRRRRSLGYELALVIGLKLIALVALYLLFFSPQHRPAIDPAARIAGAVPVVQR
jgi:hypothetical protein